MTFLTLPSLWLSCIPFSRKHVFPLPCAPSAHIHSKRSYSLRARTIEVAHLLLVCTSNSKKEHQGCNVRYSSEHFLKFQSFPKSNLSLKSKRRERRSERRSKSKSPKAERTNAAQCTGAIAHEAIGSGRHRRSQQTSHRWPGRPIRDACMLPRMRRLRTQQPA